MTLEACYSKMGADYAGTIQRLYSENFVQKMLIKFLEDPSFQDLRISVEQNRREEAFRAAHSLKGVSQNLGFTGLYELSAELTERLRVSMDEEALRLYEKTEQEYRKTTEIITTFRAEAL